MVIFQYPLIFNDTSYNLMQKKISSMLLAPITHRDVYYVLSLYQKMVNKEGLSSRHIRSKLVDKNRYTIRLKSQHKLEFVQYSFLVHLM